MIEALDETIKQLIIQKMPLNQAEVDISFDVPNREWSGAISKPTINVYLHDIRENIEQKQTGGRVERKVDGSLVKLRPSNYYDLSYLITAWTANVEDEHRLLWYVLATLVRYPQIPPEVLQTPLNDSSPRLLTKIAQPDGILRNAADVWTALDNQLKPVLTYVVTLPLPQEEIPSGPPVRTKFLRFYPLAPLRENETRQNGQGDIQTDTLVLDSEYTQIGGYISDASDPERAIAAEVVLIEQGLNVRADAEGRFKFSNIVKRPSYTLLVVAPGYITARQEVSIPGASYDLKLQPETNDAKAK